MAHLHRVMPEAMRAAAAGGAEAGSWHDPAWRASDAQAALYASGGVQWEHVHAACGLPLPPMLVQLIGQGPSIACSNATPAVLRMAAEQFFCDAATALAHPLVAQRARDELQRIRGEYRAGTLKWAQCPGQCVLRPCGARGGPLVVSEFMQPELRDACALALWNHPSLREGADGLALVTS